MAPECAALRLQIRCEREEREALERRLAERLAAAGGAGHVQHLVGHVDADTPLETYQEYAQGNPYQERRIVLDKTKLESDQRTRNIIIQNEKNLLISFLAYFKEECHHAALAKEPVLLLVFGHGDDATKGIELGDLPASMPVPVLAAPNTPNAPDPDGPAPVVVRLLPVRAHWPGRLFYLVAAVLMAVMAWMAGHQLVRNGLNQP
ncbi:MAG: hypothetical protein M1826_005836 [Phylliscum demangeonii]|nr:MAG: hypothetical protein M1826_005836 [Phylliscum demangeonii]